MSFQESMGGQGVDISPVTLQVVGIVVPFVVLACLALHTFYVVQVFRFPERVEQGRLHLIWRPVHWRMLAWLLLFFLCANLLLSGGLGFFAVMQGVEGGALERLNIAVSGLGSYVAVLLSMAWLFSRDALGWRDIFGCRDVSLGASVRGGVGFLFSCFPVCWLASILALYVFYKLGIPMEKQRVFGFFEEAQPLWFNVVLGFVAVVGAPVVEELVFRGMLLPLLSKYVSIGKAVVIVSVIFAGIHLHVLSFFPLFIFSLYLSFATLYFRTLLAPIVMHMLFNGVNLLLFLAVHA